jgi:hypothetical protein
MGTVFYLSPLLIYFPRLLTAIETQPFLPFILAMLAIARHPIAFNVSGLIAMALLLCAPALISTIFGVGAISPLPSLQLIWGPIYFVGAVSLHAAPPSRRALAIVTILVALVAALEIIFPGAYGTLSRYLLTRQSIYDGHRGISLLTPEPTYALIGLVYLFVLARWSAVHHRCKQYIIEICLAVLIFATFSTYAFPFIVAFSICLYPKSTLCAVSVLLLGFATGSSLFNIQGDERSIRAVTALVSVLSADFFDLMSSITALDASLGSRLVSNAAGFHALLAFPFGSGLGCDALTTVFTNLRYEAAFNNPVLVEVMEDGCLKPHAYLPSLFLAAGTFAIPFLLVFWLIVRSARARSSNSKLSLLPLSFAAILLLLQGQLSNPVAWIMLYIAIVGY